MTDTPSHDEIDAWADDPEGPVALYLRQPLLPVEGKGGVIFPPTYADIGYNIDELADGTRIATIDSVGSQANRIEPIFLRRDDRDNPRAALVPQVWITYEDRTNTPKRVSILEAGHRLGDAVIRSSELAEAAKGAFRHFLDHDDAAKIAKIAPTSLLFGVWDSRDTQAKLPRIIQSIIRAHDVTELHRAAQYNPTLDYVAKGLLEESNEKKEQDKRSERGFRHAPAIWRDEGRKEKVLGGVIAHGPIRRDVTVNLVALRRLDGKDGRALRRYILGLALVAAAEPLDGFLRAGCLLTPDPDDAACWTLVTRSGERAPIEVDAVTALSYAEEAATEFGVGRDDEVRFNKSFAEDDLDLDEKPAKKNRKAKD